MSKNKTKFPILNTLIFASLLTSAASGFAAPDGFSVEAGRGTQSSIAQIGMQFSSDTLTQLINQPSLRVYWEPSFALISARKYQDQPGQSHTLYDMGITPVVRWQGNSALGWFGEIGIGANYVSPKYDNAGKIMGTPFQFGDFAGVGYQFNPQLSVSLKFKHFSNAGIKEPNPAVNFGIVRLAYSF